jgi:hypothetical protein
MLATACAVLGQGTRVDGLSRGLTLASLCGLVALAVLADRPAAAVLILLAGAAVAGLVELWFAVRVALDAALFHQMEGAANGPDWDGLDHALTELRMMPEAKTGRPVALRIVGAFGLLRLQIIALVVQCALIVAAASAGMAR